MDEHHEYQTDSPPPVYANLKRNDTINKAILLTSIMSGFNKDPEEDAMNSHM